VTDARLVAPLPEGGDDRTMALAAGACSNRTTAMLVLEEVARLRPGERVLAHAAAGGVGSQLGPCRWGWYRYSSGASGASGASARASSGPFVLAAAAPASRATAIAARSG
jgi:hypothetical protein